MRRKFSLSLRSRYLILYLILLALPIFILSYIIHFGLITHIQEEAKNNSKNEVVQVQELMDSEWATLFNMSYNLSFNRILTPNNLTDYNQVRIAQQDLNFKYFDPFIYDLLYYSRSEGFLFSSTSSYSVDLFVDKYYQFEHWTTEEFLEDVNHSDKQFIRPAENVKPLLDENLSLLTYGMPVPVNSSNPHGTLLFFIEEEKINNLFANIVKNKEGFSFVLSEDGKVLASFQAEDISPEPIIKLVTETDSLFNTLELNNQSYFITTVPSSYNNEWHYVSAVPESQLMNSINEIRSVVFISYLVILFFGLAVIYYAMKVNYLPLSKFLDRFSNNGEKSSYRNEFDYIYNIFDETEARNLSLKQQIEESKPIIQQHFLISLISGQIESFSEFNELAKDFDITMEEEEYFVVLFDIEGSSFTHLQKNSKVNRWVSALPNAEKHNIYLMETSLIATIISGEPDFSLLEEWFNDIVDTEDFKVTLGVGTAYNKATGIGRSHLEAHTALEYRVIKGSNKILIFEELTNNQEDISWYDKRIVEEIGYYIRNLDKENLKESVDEILDMIQRNDTDLFMAKSIFFELSSMLMRLVDEVRLINQEEASSIPDIIQIHDFHSIDEIEETIHSMISSVYTIYDNIEENKEDILINQIIHYLEENFTDDQFSTAQLAAYFELSEAYLMRYFKKHTGKTILQYLTNLRIEYAKHLLVTTDEPVKDIVPKIGYIDVSSFIRRFKRNTNYTPGQFRKKYQT